MKQQSKRLPSYIEELTRRNNIKSKRRKNVIKKAMELQSMCGLDLLIVIKDTEYDKIQIYNSSPEIFKTEMLET